jgi:hypothetical protein
MTVSASAIVAAPVGKPKMTTPAAMPSANLMTVFRVRNARVIGINLSPTGRPGKPTRSGVKLASQVHQSLLSLE